MSEPTGQLPQNFALGPRYVLPPWRVCLYGSVPALVFAFLYGVFENFEFVRLPLISPFSAAYVLGPFSLGMVIWGAAAVIRRRSDGHALEAALGLALALAAFAVTVAAAIGYIGA